MLALTPDPTGPGWGGGGGYHGDERGELRGGGGYAFIGRRGVARGGVRRAAVGRPGWAGRRAMAGVAVSDAPVGVGAAGWRGGCTQWNGFRWVKSALAAVGGDRGLAAKARSIQARN
jgi:hypothetical protein